MNQASTRSHCIFTVHVCRREPGSATVRRSKLHLVDLAGSDRVSKTGLNGQLLTEAKFINRSLHYLEQVSMLLFLLHFLLLPTHFLLYSAHFLLHSAHFPLLHVHFLPSASYSLPVLHTSLPPQHIEQRMQYLLCPTGDPGAVREEPLPRPLQELHVDLGAAGQPWGELHHHHDRHTGGRPQQPGREDERPHEAGSGLAGTDLCLSCCLSVQESISTCRFAQRVALISNEAVLNEELDPALVRTPPTTGCVPVGVSHLAFCRFTAGEPPVSSSSADRSSEAGGADAEGGAGAAAGGAEGGASEPGAGDQVQRRHGNQAAQRERDGES